MEKSIETIWKEGFLKSDALVAPKLNDLYAQKSTHIVDRFARMYTINRIAIIAFAFIVLPVSFIVEIPYMGILMFILFNAVVIVSNRFKKRLALIDKSQNSYEYLNSFDLWVKDLVSVNTKLSRYLYPYVFLALVIGFWFGGIGGSVPGVEFMNELILDHPDMYLLFGLPIYGVLGMIIAISLLAYFGGRIGNWDLNLVYGGILNRLDEMLAEMEELRK